MINLILVLLIFSSLFNLTLPQESKLNKILGNGTIFFVDENNGWIFDEYHIRKTNDGGTSWEVMLTFETNKEPMYSSTKNSDLIYFVNSQTGYFITPKYGSISDKSYLYKTTNGGTTWIRYKLIITNNTNEPSSMKNLFFIDENTGWVASVGNILKTTNGGVTWEQVYTGTLGIQKIHFTDSQNGWAYINNKLNKSIDGGVTWNEIVVPGSTYIYTISCNGNNVWVGGYNDGIYKSTDNGVNWNKVSNTFPSGPQTWSNGYFKMFNLTHGVSNGHITTDGGITWTEKFNRYNFYSDVSLLNINNCWFYDNNGNLNKSTDFFNTSEVVFHNTNNILNFNYLSSIEIVNNNLVIATFANGGILRSSDAGKTWKFIKDLYGIHLIRDISFANSTTGIVVGKKLNILSDTAYISRTTDGGATWSLVYQLPGNEDIYSVDYSNGIYFAQSNSKKLRSTNNGLNWSADSTDLQWGLNQIQFNGNIGYGVSPSGNPRLYKTINGGTGWNIVLNITCVGSLNVITENLIYANFSDSLFSKSTDGGITWTKTGWTPNSEFNRIFFKDAALGVAVGGNLSFGAGTFITENGGNSWTKVSELYNIIGSTSNGIDFVSKENGYIANSYGLFTMKSFGVIDSITSVENEFYISPSDFTLFQNYPNPFNPSTVISYQLSAFSNVVLKVYDVLGNEVATLVNKEKSPGNYKVHWNASEFASGLYFYKLQAGQFSSVKKLILIK